MSLLRRIMILSIPFAMGCVCSASTPGVTGQNAVTNHVKNISSVEFAKNLGAGWNFGNQFDAFKEGVYDETAWGNPRTTPGLFKKLKEYGFSSVRIPVTWLGRTGESPDYTIDKAFIDRLAEVVGYAEDAGLNVIINIHHDGADGKNWLDPKGSAADPALQAATKKHITAIWTQIAERFKDKGDFLIFESFNEIHDGGWGWGDNIKDGGKQYQVLNEWNQTFVDAVRATGGNNATRFLGVPSYCTNPDLAIAFFEKPKDSVDDRLLVAVHFYDPTTYAIEAKFTEWGHTAAPDKKEKWGDEENVTDKFDKLQAKFPANGTGLYIGEWGATRRSNERDEKFRDYYIAYVAKSAAERGIPMFFWDNNSPSAGHEAFGVINHADGTLLPQGEEVVKAIIGAQSPTVTLQDIYRQAPE